VIARVFGQQGEGLGKVHVLGDMGAQQGIEAAGTGVGRGEKVRGKKDLKAA
jgi:hypothetical protein